jgi:hypothetical protein
MSEAVATLETLWDNHVRAEQLVWLGGIGKRFSSQDFFEDDIEPRLSGETKSHPSLAPILAAPEWARKDEEEFCVWLATDGPHGILVIAETPVQTFYKSGGFSFSWGFYSREILFVTDISQIVPIALAWRDERHEAERANQASEPESV